MTPLAKYLDPAIIQQVGRLDLRARFIVEGFLAGLHSSPFQGLSVEFSEHRKYVQGDDLRTIDWNVFARTDRLFVRKHQAETHLACHILVDASASMGPVGRLDQLASDADRKQRLRRTSEPTASAGEAHLTKLEYAIHLAAALGYLVTHQQDAIGLGVIGEGLTSFLPARSRRTHLLQMLAELSDVKPAGQTGLAEGVHAAMHRIPHRGLVIVMSDLLTAPEACFEALHHVRFRGHDLIVMHVLDAVEAHFDLEGTIRLEDPESGQILVTQAEDVRKNYLDALNAWRDDLAKRLAGIKADYVPLDTSMPFDKALVEFLAQRSRRI